MFVSLTLSLLKWRYTKFFFLNVQFDILVHSNILVNK